MQLNKTILRVCEIHLTKFNPYCIIKPLKQKEGKRYVVKILKTMTMYSATGKIDTTIFGPRSVYANYDLAAI